MNFKAQKFLVLQGLILLAVGVVGKGEMYS